MPEGSTKLSCPLELIGTGALCCIPGFKVFQSINHQIGIIDHSVIYPPVIDDIILGIHLLLPEIYRMFFRADSLQHIGAQYHIIRSQQGQISCRIHIPWFCIQQSLIIIQGGWDYQTLLWLGVQEVLTTCKRGRPK